jgi:hypothetical protein
VDKKAEQSKQDVSTEESKKTHHKHYKATMPSESHQAHTNQMKDKKEEEKTSDDSEPAKTHKHHKATMNGEKHNP